MTATFRATTESPIETAPGSGSTAATEDWTGQVDAILAALRHDEELIEPEHRQWWAEYLRSHQVHFRNLLTMIVGLRNVNRVLDVGNFPGHFTIILKRLGFDVSGVDLNPQRAGRLWDKHTISVCRADVEIDSLPLPSDAFDVVVFAEILEHLRINPFHALRECHRVLKPNMHIVLSVPNVSPRHRIRFLLGRDYQGDIVKEFQCLESVGHMGHFRLYSKREVSRMLTYVGFEVQNTRIAGWLPGGRWRFVRFLGPFRHSFRSHLYVTARKVAQPLEHFD